MLDLVFVGTDSGVPLTSTATVTNWPTQPYVGEVVHTRITGDDGSGAANPLRDTWAVTDVGESAPALAFEPGFHDPAAIPGRGFCYAYRTPGAKTQTVQTFGYDTPLRSQSVAEITVLDPNLETWTHEYYIDLNGDASGMPSQSGTRTHILSWAEFIAIPGGNDTDRIRHHWRAGRTHRLPFTADLQTAHACNAAVVYVGAFGTGTRPVLQNDAGAFYTGCMIYRGNRPDQRFIFNGLHVDGQYDPVAGVFPDCEMTLFSASTGETGLSMSMVDCEIIGCHEGVSFGGVADSPTRFEIGLYGTKISNWRNYGCFTAACNRFSVTACTVRQDPLAGLGDGKNGNQINYADHGCFRMASFNDSFALVNNQLASCSGWSNEFDIQAILRANIDRKTTPNTWGVVIGNESAGGPMVVWGRPHPSFDVLGPSSCLVACNTHYFGRQEGTLVQSDAGTGGIYGHSNVCYKPLLKSNQSPAASRYTLYAGTSSPDANVAQSAFAPPVEFTFNTYVNILDGTVPQWTDGPGHERGHQHQGVVDSTTGQVAPVGRADVYAHNLISAEGMPAGTNVGTLYPLDNFSPANGFRVVAGTAADQAVTSGWVPPVDVTMTQRTGATQAGAHHATTPQRTSGPAPQTTTPPVIAADLNRAGWVYLTEDGTWSTPQSPLEDWLLEWHWQVNGTSAPTAPHNTALDSAGLSSGDAITCVITRCGISGTRVSSAPSNVLLVP